MGMTLDIYRTDGKTDSLTDLFAGRYCGMPETGDTFWVTVEFENEDGARRYVDVEFTYEGEDDGHENWVDYSDTLEDAEAGFGEIRHYRLGAAA